MGRPSRRAQKALRCVLVALTVCAVTVLFHSTGSLMMIQVSTSFNKHSTTAGFEPPQQQQRLGQSMDSNQTVLGAVPAAFSSHVPVVDSSNDNDNNIHIVFSTGCSPTQDWQSYTLFHSILVSNQRGNVTRVASGCSETQQAALQAAHLTTIQNTMSDRFHLHFTPDYSRAAGNNKEYKFFNKPFGLQHWMQHALGFSSDNNDNYHEQYDDTVFVILDPDQLVLRPFTRHFTGPELWHPAGTKQQAPSYTSVEHGRPMAQVYGFGTRWMRNVDMAAIFNNNTTTSSSSTVKKQQPQQNYDRYWTTKAVKNHFCAGPPYIATGRDMYRIVDTWANVAVPVHAQTTNHLSEMWAYVVAAVSLGLPHQMATSLMVSDVGSSGGEAWPWIDNENNNNANGHGPSSTTAKSNERVPHVLHYCQRYFLGPWFFSKYQLPKNFYTSCEHPLLAEPGPDIQDFYNTSVTLDGAFHEISALHRPRMSYMLREITRRLNHVAVYYKQHHCPVGTANMSRVFMFQRANKKNKAKL